LKFLQRLRFAAIITALLALTVTAGCSQQMLPDDRDHLSRGIVYFLDGAGGGGLLWNWNEGVRGGLLAAGYAGSGAMFDWETGLGPLMDQASSLKYKRGKAAQLALRIRQFRHQYPNSPVNLIGLSAGTAVAVFTLEALPPDCPVDNVVLLGASIASDYDLTAALRQVQGKLFVLTSAHDEVLTGLVPLTGTADRDASDAPAAGLNGFVVPAGAWPQQLYADRVVTSAWTADMQRDGNYGGHLDNVKMEFVRDYVAPLIMEGKPRP
jgi:pimeloyl-ACP methyl ester carboxylesterase